MKTYVIIPGYNEAQHVGKVIQEVAKYCKNIIFVDDGSKDNSAEIARKGGACVLRHVINMGKGAAANTGCAYALKEGADVLVLIDADGQHLPKDIPKVLKALQGNDIVFTYRTYNRRMPKVHRLGNRFLNLVTSFIYGLDLYDTQCGFRAMTKEAYKKVSWSSTDYRMESEMVARTGNAGLKYAQVPIATIYNDNFKGTTIFDGIKIFFHLIKWRII